MPVVSFYSVLSVREVWCSVCVLLAIAGKTLPSVGFRTVFFGLYAFALASLCSKILVRLAHWQLCEPWHAEGPVHPATG